MAQQFDGLAIVKLYGDFFFSKLGAETEMFQNSKTSFSYNYRTMNGSET